MLQPRHSLYRHYFRFNTSEDDINSVEYRKHCREKIIFIFQDSSWIYILSLVNGIQGAPWLLNDHIVLVEAEGEDEK